jgi:large subunit ribosomal protein L11
MAQQAIDVLVEGGKATAAPPLGPALGPTGVNIGQVVAEINKITAAYKGMQVPVKVKIDTDTKKFEISVGTPPASQLILKESGIQKGAGNPLTEKVADLKIEQIIKIAKMKEQKLLGKGLKQKVKEVVGTCQSMGILVEGVDAKKAFERIEAGEFDEKIRLEKTELSAEELKRLAEEKKKLQEEVQKRRAEFEARAKEIIASMEGKERALIKAKLLEASIPLSLIDHLLPAEAAAGDKKAEGAAAEKK